MSLKFLCLKLILIIAFDLTKCVQNNEIENVKDRGFGFLTSMEMELFSESINLIENRECQMDFNATFQGILNNEYWAKQSKYYNPFSSR